MWEAKNFGQVMYAVRTRNGGLYFKLLKRDGDLGIFEVSHCIFPTATSQSQHYDHLLAPTYVIQAGKATVSTTIASFYPSGAPCY